MAETGPRCIPPFVASTAPDRLETWSRTLSRVSESVDLAQHAGRSLAALAAELMHPLYVLARSAMGALDLLFSGLA